MVRPVPIPNTAVKHSLADGSGFIDSARVGCRQFFLKKPKHNCFGFFIGEPFEGLTDNGAGFAADPNVSGRVRPF